MLKSQTPRLALPVQQRMIFPRTSYMHKNYTYFMPLSLQSTLSSNTKSTWSKTWKVFTVHVHSWSKNSVLFLVEFHFRISCLSTKLLLSLFQVYALMHTLWAWSSPVQATYIQHVISKFLIYPPTKMYKQGGGLCTPVHLHIIHWACISDLASFLGIPIVHFLHSVSDQKLDSETAWEEG